MKTRILIMMMLSATVLTGGCAGASSRPRGLASIVFGIIVLNAGLPGGRFLSIVVACTVFLSLVAHGVSANPLAKWLAMKENSGKKE